MNKAQKGVPDKIPGSDVVSSASLLDGDANRRVTQKARRAVRDAVISTQEQRSRHRRNLGLAILSFVFMLVLLGPAVWNGVEELLGEEPLFDLPTQITFLIGMLFLAMLAALIAVWKGQHNVQHDRRGFETFPPIEK
jgi:sterol desaturase/sphingolipid hydroxylase (fatty acid hydroxylase superfamily)